MALSSFQITPVAHVASDLVTARFGMSEDLVNQYDAESVAALDALAVGDFSVPMGNLDLALETLDPPNIGEAPTPDAVTPYVTQAQPVTISDLAALRALLGLVDISVEQVDLPNLDAISPAISLPDAPDDALPTVPRQCFRLLRRLHSPSSKEPSRRRTLHRPSRCSSTTKRLTSQTWLTRSRPSCITM